jgi:uncharacterized protein involved in copper resistance
MSVGVRVHHLAVAVRVHMERATPPAHQQAYPQDHDHHADDDLERVLDGVGQIAVEHDDGQAERDQRAGMSHAPRQPEAGRAAPPDRAFGERQRGDRGQVVRVGGVPKSEQERDDQGEEERTAPELGDVVVEFEHRYSRGRLRVSDSTKP